MLFAIVNRDKEGFGQLRADTRQQHLDYLQGKGAMVKIAGPLLNADNEPIGSLLIIEAPTLDAAKEFVAKDPYTVAGLFQAAQVTPWRQAFGAPLA